jgi:hypothetical protein
MLNMTLKEHMQECLRFSLQSAGGFNGIFASMTGPGILLGGFWLAQVRWALCVPGVVLGGLIGMCLGTAPYWFFTIALYFEDQRSESDKQ